MPAGIRWWSPGRRRAPAFRVIIGRDSSAKRCKRFLRQMPTATVFLWAMPVGALVLAPTVDFVTKSPTTWLLIVVMAGITSFGAITTYYAGLARLEATPAAVLATFEPVVAAVVGLAVFNERLGLWGWSGSVMILGAVVLVVFSGGSLSRFLGTLPNLRSVLPTPETKQDRSERR